jgi:hypothetical protein
LAEGAVFEHQHGSRDLVGRVAPGVMAMAGQVQHRQSAGLGDALRCRGHEGETKLWPIGVYPRFLATFLALR